MKARQSSEQFLILFDGVVLARAAAAADTWALEMMCFWSFAVAPTFTVKNWVSVVATGNCETGSLSAGDGWVFVSPESHDYGSTPGFCT